MKSRRLNVTASVQTKFDFTKFEPIDLMAKLTARGSNLLVKFSQNGRMLQSALSFGSNFP